MLCHVIICNSDSWCGPFKRVMLFSFVSPCYCCGQIPEIWELDHPVGGLLVTHMNVKFIWVVCVWFEILWKVLTPLDDWNAILFHASSSSSYRSVTFFFFRDVIDKPLWLIGSPWLNSLLWKSRLGRLLGTTLAYRGQLIWFCLTTTEVPGSSPGPSIYFFLIFSNL